jgi:hypothetical protein
MGKTWVLDTETKGTGANMVPLEKTLRKPAPKSEPAARPPSTAAPRSRRPAKPEREVERWSSPLPPGHVRKKATGEIGRVRSVDPKAGTATVAWLKHGTTSTVALSAISRR